MNNYLGGYRIMQGRFNTMNPGGNARPFPTVPVVLNRDFVKCLEILAWIDDKCAGPGARAALERKSQLAIQYAHDIRDASPQTFDASTKYRFEEAYKGSDVLRNLQITELQRFRL